MIKKCIQLCKSAYNYAKVHTSRINYIQVGLSAYIKNVTCRTAYMRKRSKIPICSCLKINKLIFVRQIIQRSLMILCNTVVSRMFKCLEKWIFKCDFQCDFRKNLALLCHVSWLAFLKSWAEKIMKSWSWMIEFGEVSTLNTAKIVIKSSCETFCLWSKFAYLFLFFVKTNLID